MSRRAAVDRRRPQQHIRRELLFTSFIALVVYQKPLCVSEVYATRDFQEDRRNRTPIQAGKKDKFLLFENVSY